MKSVFKWVFLFCTGGVLYWCMEMMARGRSHWTMVIVGGICFFLCGVLNEIFTFSMPLLLQGVLGAVLITVVEFISGCIINLCYCMEVWDYSNFPLNVLGQICLPFSILWIFVAILAVIIDDYLRYWLFDEEKPHYKIL